MSDVSPPRRLAGVSTARITRRSDNLGGEDPRVNPFKLIAGVLAVLLVLNISSRMAGGFLGDVEVLAVIAIAAGGWGWFAARRWINVLTALDRGCQLGYVLNVKPHGQETELRVDVMTSRQLRSFRVWGHVPARRWIAFDGREVYATARRHDRFWARVMPDTLVRA